MIISLGDTPSCSLLDDFTGVDEIRPGNFVFYDLMQEQIGSCKMEEIAVALASPIIAKNAKRHEIAVYGGAIHLSKEYILDEKGHKCFGRIVQLHDSEWSSPLPDATVISLSQEHGIIKVTEEYFDNFQIGDLLGILPVHSCLTAAAMGEYYSWKGNRIDHFK
jgi:D-serine deaminase-like pyridoxal phosphate-dependent protein